MRAAAGPEDFRVIGAAREQDDSRALPGCAPFPPRSLRPNRLAYPRRVPLLLECVRYLFLTAGRGVVPMPGAVRIVEGGCLATRARPATGMGKSQLRQVIDAAVSAVFDVDVRELRAPTRGSTRAAFARQVAMYLAHVVCGLSLTEVGALFARDRTTAAHACRVVEDQRDDPELDGRLDHLERAIACLIDALFARRG